FGGDLLHVGDGAVMGEFEIPEPDDLPALSGRAGDQAKTKRDQAKTALQHHRPAPSGLSVPRRPKSGAAVSCPASMTCLRMPRLRAKKSKSSSPRPQPPARCSRARSSVKRPSTSSTASRLLRKMSRHMVGSEAAMRVKSRKPEAENLITS